MIRGRIVPFVLAAGLLLAADPAAQAQQGEKKEKKEKKYKEKSKGNKEREKEYKDREKDAKDREKDLREKEKDAREREMERAEDRREREKEYRENQKERNEENRDRRVEERSGEKRGGILGRVVLPPAGTASPRQLQGVPKGHYPPPGQCRIWYPNRPPGQQPPPSNCDNLRGVRLEPGAFVLHGDKAYDADYDWREEERRRPGSVGRDILDILFPKQ